MTNPDLGFADYVQDVLLAETEKRRPLRIGTERVRAIALYPSLVVSSALGLTMRQQELNRIGTSLEDYVAPGFDLTTVLSNRARSIISALEATPSVDRAFKLWVMVEQSSSVERKVDWSTIGNSRHTQAYWLTTWIPWLLKDKTIINCGVGFFDGVAVALNGDQSVDIVQGWLDGMANAWPNALKDGLHVSDEPPARSFEEWSKAVRALLDAFESGERPDPRERHMFPWQQVVDAWQFEIFRHSLVAVGGIAWRDTPLIEKHRGVLL